jgi:hypothetical protein
MCVEAQTSLGVRIRELRSGGRRKDAELHQQADVVVLAPELDDPAIAGGDVRILPRNGQFPAQRVFS